MPDQKTPSMTILRMRFTRLITQTLTKLSTSLGRGAFLAKSDILSATGLLPIWLGDFELLGFQFDNCYYYDKCLPFGCLISCFTVEKFLSFLDWLVRKRTESREVLHYLDDFLFGGSNAGECQAIVDIFIDDCKVLGVPIAWEKNVRVCNR